MMIDLGVDILPFITWKYVYRRLHSEVSLQSISEDISINPFLII